jgi:hypothetical protein
MWYEFKDGLEAGLRITGFLLPLAATAISVAYGAKVLFS